MASNTFTKIASVTVGSGGASTIDFNSIPNTYTDLALLISTRNTRNDGSFWATLQFTFNNTTSNRTRKNLYGYQGTTAGSDSGTDFAVVSTSSSATSSVFDNIMAYIPNYTSSNYKSMTIDGVTENNNTSNYLYLNASLWSDTSVINQITITPTSYNFVQYSSATLYGIKNS